MMKGDPKYPFKPDYAVPPGETLREVMDALNLWAFDLEYRVGISVRLTRRIIAGKAQISSRTAALLEKATGVPQTMWKNLERNYRAQLAKEKSCES